MPRLTNVKIIDCELKQKGTKGKGGPWELYKIQIDDTDWKDVRFSYFLSGNKPELSDGSELDYLEYEEKQDGQYTNYTITKVGFKEEKPLPKASASGGGGGNSYISQEFELWKGSLPTHYGGEPTFGNFLLWKSRSMFYAYGKDLTIKILDQVWSKSNRVPAPEAISALVIYFAETLFKGCQGNRDTLRQARATYDGLMKAIEELENTQIGPQTPPSGEKMKEPAKPKPRGKQKPEPDEKVEEPPQEPTNGDGTSPLTYTKEEATKEAAQWVFKTTEITNLPHLENWWKKMCGSPERKALEAADKEAWEGIERAYELRKQQLKEEFAQQKEAEESGIQPDLLNDEDMF